MNLHDDWSGVEAWRYSSGSWEKTTLGVLGVADHIIDDAPDERWRLSYETCDGDQALDNGVMSLTVYRRGNRDASSPLYWVEFSSGSDIDIIFTDDLPDLIDLLAKLLPAVAASVTARLALRD